MDLIPEPITGQFTLVVLPRGAAGLMLRAAARLACRGPLRVLDCGNCFNTYQVALELRRLGADPLEAALERIRAARAFTCYQALTLLETSPALPTPTLVLDLLGTFRDESVALPERRRLLRGAIDHLQRLAEVAPLLVSVSPRPEAAGARVGIGALRLDAPRMAAPGRRDAAACLPGAAVDDEFLTTLESAAGRYWRFGPPPPVIPMKLF